MLVSVYVVSGYDMSTFIRRYAKYLNEKAVSYRQMAFDFCKVKRGWVDWERFGVHYHFQL